MGLDFGVPYLAKFPGGKLKFPGGGFPPGNMPRIITGRVQADLSVGLKTGLLSCQAVVFSNCSYKLLHNISN